MGEGGAGAARGARIGVMGGTFDPVHLGHLVAAAEAGRAFGLDEVVFVPAGEPWQKEARRLAPAEDRYAMTVIATAADPLFSVSRVDIERAGPTYTVDTLADLSRERGPEAEFFLIVGADTLSGLGTWKDPGRLLALARVICCTRPDHPLRSVEADGDRISVLEIPQLEISSTLCRDRVRAGLPVRYLVPDGVAQYIAKRGLYRE